MATAKRDPVSWFGWREHGANDHIAMMHTDISRAYFHAPSMEENTLSCHQKMWRSGYPEYGRQRVPLHGTRDAAANWEDAYAKVLTEHGFTRGAAFCCKERGIKVVVRGDDFLSGGPRSQLGWLEQVMDKHFEAKHTVMGESSSLKKSIVMLNRRISWRNSGIMYEPDTKHCQRIVEALNLQQAKTAGSPAVKDNEIGVQRGECSWESLQHDQTQWDSTGGHLGEEKARVYRSTVSRPNLWAVDRPDLQHAVRVCSKSAAKPTADE